MGPCIYSQYVEVEMTLFNSCLQMHINVFLKVILKLQRVLFLVEGL